MRFEPSNADEKDVLECETPYISGVQKFLHPPAISRPGQVALDA
jgi:hypothetical protein